VADLLTPWWEDRSTLVVVSTDLSHYEPDASARAHDAQTAAAVLRADAVAIGDRDACGARPLRVLLTLAGRGHARMRQLGLATSADAGGTPRRVVGYGAFAVEATA
jgi:AmmeMemoRadiSam system protein B